MPILETPPNPAPPPPPPPVKVRTGRFGELDEHELIHLLGALDDERARARFRESIYISFILCVAIAWLICYGPQVLFHQPRLINPADVLRQRDKELTVLNVPKDLPKSTPRKSTKNIADQDHAQQNPKPTLDKKTLEQLQRQAAQQPAPQPAQQQAQTPAPQQQQPPPAPLPQHAPQQPPLIDSPRPSPNRPSFNTPNQTAGDAIRQAAQSALANRGGGTDYGNAPTSRGGGNFGGTEILSDTMGTNFGPYLRRILSDIKRNWDPLLPEEARYPLNKQGETFIRFTIGKDGKILAMTLEDSTHDIAIDKSCWNAIKAEGQFPPLPTEFPGPNLELRIHFLVNKTPQ
jgi:outer membrane biosynthesis protein TonB